MRTILSTICLAVFLTLVFGCGLIIPESVPEAYCEPCVGEVSVECEDVCAPDDN